MAKLSRQLEACLATLLALLPLCLAATSVADTHYVNVSNTVPVHPYTNWATAATVIQDAVDAASAGDTVLVTNGVYGPISTANRAITVQGVNGVASTIIDGAGSNRCASIGGPASDPKTVLIGLTLRNGKASIGGGVHGGMLRHCRLSGNSASFEGGGAYNSTLNSCVLVGNYGFAAGGGAGSSRLNTCIVFGNDGFEGGGAHFSALRNCAVYGNTAFSGGGVWSGSLSSCTVYGNLAYGLGGGADAGPEVYNSILWNNSAPDSPNWRSGTFRHSCTTPLPPGEGNISHDPLLASATHLSSASPCIGGGDTSSVGGEDIDGELWSSPPSMGCDEYVSGAVTGELSTAIRAQNTTLAVGFESEFKADIDGRATGSHWEFWEGTVISNRPYARHAWSTPGDHVVTLMAFNESYPEGVSASVVVTVLPRPVHYVDLENTGPVAPFLSWDTAATSIQAAVDAATVPGALVLATNGVYESGGRAVSGSMTNRIAIDKPITVRSVSGPGVTTLRGRGPLGDGAVRCAYVGTNAMLAGFTLTGGHTRTYGDWDNRTEDSGGGAYCEIGARIANCVITANSAAYRGGGVRGGMLSDCTLSGNSAEGDGGGAAFAILSRCSLIGNSALGQGNGGGVAFCTLEAGILRDNASEEGGGAYSSTLRNCLLHGNSALRRGGGAYVSRLQWCTLCGNSSLEGGGTYACTVGGCIAWDNHAEDGPNWFLGTNDYCCTTPLPGGIGNVTNAPLFADAVRTNFRLSAESLCIDAGPNAPWMFDATDVDGNRRIFNGTVDMGAHEFTMHTRVHCMFGGAYSPATVQQCVLLASNGDLPTNAPYAPDALVVAAVPSNSTDWILLELQKTNDFKIVASRSVLLRSDGKVLNTKGGKDVRLECSPGHYYLVTKHRNHLTAMSAQPIAYTNSGVVAYDFTTGPDKYYGGTNACVQLSSNLWGMIAGDADGDGKITWVDRTIVSNQLGMTGYLQGDLNLDGKVDGKD